MTLTVAFALAAALSSAVNLMTHHSASAGAPQRKKGWRLVAYLILSIWLFDERFTDSPARIAIAVLAMAVVAVGVIALSRTAPKDLNPS